VPAAGQTAPADGKYWARAWPAFWRGLRRACPACGRGRLFSGYLAVHETCGHCEIPLSIYRADDAPPYFTVAIVGHVVIPGVLVLEATLSPPTWIQMAIWLPLTLGLTLALLPLIKGAVIGVQWALGLTDRKPENA
jgi:uncharacterized protein (DUF983 family)